MAIEDAPDTAAEVERPAPDAAEQTAGGYPVSPAASPGQQIVQEHAAGWRPRCPSRISLP